VLSIPVPSNPVPSNPVPSNPVPSTIARRLPALLALSLLLPLAAAAQPQHPPTVRMALHVYVFQHRAAADAVPLVRPLLSSHGSLLIKRDGKTLMVRDTVAGIARVVPMLRSLDRPVIPLDLEVMLVRAERSFVSPPQESTIPPALARELGSILPYDVYLQVAHAELATREGEEVTYEVGAGYTLRFRLGRYQGGGVKLYDFRVYRAGREEPMVHANLFLRLDETYSLGLSKSESSPTALMVVLTCRHLPPRPMGRR
jgi:hypothetical protein